MYPETLDYQAVDDTYRPKVLRYLRRLAGERDAEDLTQAAMLKVSEGLALFRGEAQLSTWIYRIATNVALDRVRTGHFQFEQESIVANKSAVNGWEAAEDLAEHECPSAEAMAIRGEMSACIREFVDRLPASYRAVLVLSDLEGFKNSEIAEILGLSLDTVKIRLHRARNQLKRELAAGCTFERDEHDELTCDRKPAASHCRRS